MIKKSEIKLVEQAFNQRWPITDQYRKTLINKLVLIVADPESKKREVIAAARALIAAEKQNQEDEHKIVDVELQQRNHRISVIASELGIDEDTLKQIEVGADRDTEGSKRISSDEDI